MVLTLAAGALSIAAGTVAGRNCAPFARDIALFGFLLWGPVAVIVLLVVCYWTGVRVRSPLTYVALGILVCSALVIPLVVRLGMPYKSGLCQ